MNGRQQDSIEESDDHRGVGRRRLLYGAAGLGLAGLAGSAGATAGHRAGASPKQRGTGSESQVAAAELDTFEYAHEMDINGETTFAEASGRIDPSAGRIVYEGLIDDYVPGYRYWAASVVTKAISSGGPVVAAQLAGGRNTFSLTDGELDYGFTSVMRDRFADVRTDARVERDGGTLLVDLRTQGQADYPTLLGMFPAAMRFRQTPTDRGFVETGTKLMRTADGDVVETSFESTYEDVPLDAPQIRDATIEVLSESLDHREVELAIETSVSPLRESGEGLVFAGLDHAAIGGARLGASAQSLRVESEDQPFGVSVALGDVPSLVTTPALFDTGDLPSGASLRFEAFGEVGGTADQRVGTLTVTDRGDEAEYATDFSTVGVEQSTVRVLDDGEIRAEVTGVTGTAAFVPGPIPCDPVDPVWLRDGGFRSIVEFPTPREIRLANEEVVVGDELQVVPEETPDVASLSEMRVVADGTSSFTVVDQAVGAFERPHAVFGDAVLDTTGEGLTVAEFGERSGLRVDVDDREEFLAKLDPLELGRGTSLTLRAAGLVDDRAGASLGTATVENVDDEFVLSAGFGELDADGVRLAVFDGREQVGETTLRPGEIARLPPVAIGGCGKLPPRPLPCYLVDLLETVELQTDDGSTFAGDQFRVLPAGTDAAVESISAYTFEGVGLDRMTILDERVRDVV